ncbi:Gfo/Idh/MocA family oxidoreductase [Micavibrio aeruginosavorus]|nr:Gfo/Idh/MocA family oxidoreductase [Micavibrio aeruginosavorus]
MSSVKKNIAVAGCGYWGKNLVRNFAEIGALAAVCDHNPDLANAMSVQHNVPVLTWDAVLADPAIAGVAIAAPAALHYTLAKQAMLAGKDVFVEKPLSLDVNEAQELCQLAEKNGRILMVGHLLQYHAAFLKLKDMVASGELGRLNYIYSNRLNLGKIRREEDILWSFAPHDLSMILALAGQEPEQVHAHGTYTLHNSIADATITHLEFASGLNAHVFVSWLHPFKEQKLVVVGEKGMAVFDDGQAWPNKLTLYRHAIQWNGDVPVPEKADGEAVELVVSEPLRGECQHFADCIDSRKSARTDGREGLRVLKVLDRASKALKSERPVVKAVENSHPGVMVHESAYVDQPSTIGAGTKIWHFSHVLPNTVIGKNCVIGQNCVLGPDVSVGNTCKIQNNVSLYKGVVLEDGVFCGPSCVFTNVNNPRAEIERKSEYRQTLVKRGATIGANATIVCGHTLGEYCFIAAGAVVASNVPAFALMAGVPAKRIGWMSHAGAKLGADLVCPLSGDKYREDNGTLVLVEQGKKDVSHG